MDLLQNIIDSFFFVKNDFLSFNSDIYVFIQFISNFLLALFIIFIFYLLGEQIRKKLFNDIIKYKFFINIALGYIIVGSGLGLLGTFSLLQKNIINFYLIFIVAVSLSLFISSKYRQDFRKKIRLLLKIKIDLNNNLISLGVILFIAIAFFRLATPEIGEDGYHTDLPSLYLKWESTMHESRESLHVIPYPQLPEMIYIIPVFFESKESARFIHFGFYLLIILLLSSISREKKYSFAKFVPLLFVTAPGVVRYSSTQFTDFFAIFPFILSLLLVKEKMPARSIILSGMLFGAVVSAKIWMLVYLPAIIAYLIFLNKNLQYKKILKMILFFILGYISVSLLWYVRTTIIMGSPIYPILNKKITPEINQLPRLPFSNYFGLNWEMFFYKNLVILSPLFFLGVGFAIGNYKKIIYKIKDLPIFIFIIILTLEQLVIRVAWGRYILTWFIFASFIASAGIVYLLKKHKIAQLMFIGFYSILFLYYFINTLLVLPYGLNLADKNKYLTRTMFRQAGNYYDFDNRFKKHISQEDLVGIYAIGNLYYANFSYLDIGYVLDNNHRDFGLLKKAGITKLLINGGDIKWLCSKISLENCSENRYKLLAKYPDYRDIYTLYSIE